MPRRSAAAPACFFGYLHLTADGTRAQFSYALDGISTSHDFVPYREGADRERVVRGVAKRVAYELAADGIVNSQWEILTSGRTENDLGTQEERLARDIVPRIAFEQGRLAASMPPAVDGPGY